MGDDLAVEEEDIARQLDLDTEGVMAYVRALASAVGEGRDNL
jgi:hypothetical protein